MPFIPNTDEQRQEMLKKIGVSSFAELIADIPEEIRLKADLCLPFPLSEIEVKKLLREMAEINADLEHHISFLGGGAYDHFIPSVISQIISRPEFYTAYTPYQAEVSQGTLQTIYEYQSLICELTGMDVSNASMYDGASALAEAGLMAHSYTKRSEIIVLNSLHPYYQKVLQTYVCGLNLSLKKIEIENGICSELELKKSLSEKTAAVLIQHPNFFGCLEPVEEITNLAHQFGALSIVCVDPISLGLLKSPGESGVDIVVGEGQALGIPQSFGGPYLGIFACKKELVRLMPGRIVGATTDAKGQKGYVLTLQTREQHIRREKATSNICTNEALCALAATIYLSIMGKEGLRKVAELCLQKSHYACEEMAKIPGFKQKFSAPFFKEFVIQTPISPKKIIQRLESKKIFAGIDLGRFSSEYQDCLLVAVTEKRTKEEIDLLVSELQKI
ncbi:MAG: aminomethyl-transferring glycine dehydrogenase subunit GcvPA [Candidatus Edwardsbacteria bacterium]